MLETMTHGVSGIERRSSGLTGPQIYCELLSVSQSLDAAKAMLKGTESKRAKMLILGSFMTNSSVRKLDKQRIEAI